MKKNLSNMKGLLIGAGALGRNLYSLCISQGILFSAIVEKDQNISDLPKEILFTSLEQLSPNLSFDFIAVCVEDKNIGSVAKAIADKFQDLSGKYCFHTSGAMDSSILSPLKDKGIFTGSLHPLMTFKTDPVLSSVKEVPFAIEGDPKCEQFLQEFVRLMQGKPVFVPSGLKVSYHLLGVFASNLFYGLLDELNTILARLNREGLDISMKNLEPIITETVQSAFQSDITADTISGPVKRKDFNIIRRHVFEMNEKYPGLLSLYKELSFSLARICHYSENDIKQLNATFSIDPLSRN